MTTKFDNVIRYICSEIERRVRCTVKFNDINNVVVRLTFYIDDTKFTCMQDREKNVLMSGNLDSTVDSIIEDIKTKYLEATFYNRAMNY